MRPHRPPCCAVQLSRVKIRNIAYSDRFAREGQRWRCPVCLKEYEHRCKTPEGCKWNPILERVEA